MKKIFEHENINTNTDKASITMLSKLLIVSGLLSLFILSYVGFSDFQHQRKAEQEQINQFVNSFIANIEDAIFYSNMYTLTTISKSLLGDASINKVTFFTNSSVIEMPLINQESSIGCDKKSVYKLQGDRYSSNRLTLGTLEVCHEINSSLAIAAVIVKTSFTVQALFSVFLLSALILYFNQNKTFQERVFGSFIHRSVLNVGSELGPRLVRRVLVVGVLFSLIALMVLGALEYDRQRNRATEEVDRIVIAMTPLIEEAVWWVNRHTILTTAQSLSEVSSISTIKISTEFGDFENPGASESTNGSCDRNVKIPIKDERFSQSNETLGSIEICQSFDDVVGVVTELLITGVPLQVMLLFSFAVMVLYLIHRSVVAPLNELKSLIAKGTDIGRIQLTRWSGDEGDEIDLVVDELRHLTQRLANERDIAETTLLSINNGILVLDNTRQIQRTNNAALQILDCDLSALVGQTLSVILNLKAQAVETKRSSIDLINVYTLVHNIVIEVSESPIMRGDRLLGYIVVINDVTEQRMMQQRFIQSEKIEAIGALTSGVAHDFNNLLSVIMGNLELYTFQSKIDIEQSDALNTIMSSCVRAATLTDSLLSYSRRQNLESHVVEIDAVFESLEKLLARTIPSNITLKFENTSTSGVFADPTYLQTAMLNLAINARDAMENGGSITISSSDKVPEAALDTLSKKESEQFVALIVSDTGCGMTPEVLTRVTEPFFTTKEVGKGTGLGLSMVVGFAEQSGGLAHIESSPCKGTKIYLILPAIKETEVSSHSAKNPFEQPSAIIHSKPLKIFFVEDNPDVRTVMVAALDNLGHKVTSASCLSSAMSQAGNLQEYDLLLTDFQLPDGNGLELVENFRILNPNLPVIVVSGDIPVRLAKELSGKGNVQLLLKPASLPQLTASIALATKSSSTAIDH